MAAAVPDRLEEASMARKCINNWMVATVVSVCTVVVCLSLGCLGSSQTEWFTEEPTPLGKPYRLFDVGITDVNDDGLLDIFTSNHHFRQQLLIADGHGGYDDMLSEWRLDQSVEFPHAELSLVAPVMEEPGLYIYWFSTKLVIQAHGGGATPPWRGRLGVNSGIKIFKNDGFNVEKSGQESRESPTTVKFSVGGEGKLLLKPSGQGLPITFRIEGEGALDHVYVGAGMVSPRSRTFALTMQDRHALAWADYNDDGMLDIFINRGALGGMLRAYPEYIQRGIEDELLVSDTGLKYSEIGAQVGIAKNGCSGRHARWLDFNHDGRLDLYQNCFDRKHVDGIYPKQLYQQDKQGRFHDIAVQAGVDMPDQQLGSLLWIDIDNDGDDDLVTFQDEGVFLYRNNSGHLVREAIYRGAEKRERTIGTSRGESDRWLFDGKLSAADFDGDGDLDLFAASKYGNRLFVNREGRLAYVEPRSVGLPSSSITANWVDYDNDGLADLHVVPEGIFRQRADHTFEAKRIFRLRSGQYVGAICNWFDFDNDGWRDLLMTLSTNRTFKRWWEFNKKPLPISDWNVKLYRNLGSTNHWLQVKLKGRKGNPQGIGSQVTVVTGGRRQVQEVGSTDGAFFSQGHYRLYFGLGTHDSADAIVVRWSDGSRKELNDIKGDRLFVVTEEM